MKLNQFPLFDKPITEIPVIGRTLINTINAHSYNVAQKDIEFQEALMNSNVLLCDGISVVLAKRWLTGVWLSKIAGADLFFFEMGRLNATGGKCFFFGSSNDTLERIQKRAKIDYPNITVFCYSPPFKAQFTEEDNNKMISIINAVTPEVLFVGMTAPKQEKWAYQHVNRLLVGHVCCIGAVFDFYAGTVNRAPKWMIKLGLEWLYRLLKEPKRMWRRYLIGNFAFIWRIFLEKYFSREMV